jgi:magnesium transporter
VAAVAPLTILSTSIIATLAASLSPWVLDRLGVDPAMASGPVATVLQDLLSAAIYLGIATYYALTFFARSKAEHSFHRLRRAED